MGTKRIEKIKKRSGKIVSFDKEKIEKAVYKAVIATGQGDGEISKKISDKVVEILKRRIEENSVPSVEQVQDIVEEVLIHEDFIETAKAYILYRERRREVREEKKELEGAIKKIDDYLDKSDWEIKENANMAFSLQGLNRHSVTNVIKKYWLNKIYSEDLRRANEEGDLHVHDLDTLGPYCVGWDLFDFLLKGFGGVRGKVESKPPKHFRAALGQIVNFMYTLQGEAAGAIAFSNFDTLLAPFIKYDGLSYKQVKQAMQEFMFNMSVPTRTGFQCPFTNVTLDLEPAKSFAEQSVVIGGEPQDETYKEFQEEMNMFNKAFYEVMIEGDKNGRVFTFPIPTINITKDFEWDNPVLEPLWEATVKYGVNYFANYINSDMDPDDARSMCCRLRLDKKQLYNRGGGGLFGSGSLTGSIGVVTINIPRIGYLSKNKKEFFEKLDRLMDIAKNSLEVKRKTVEGYTEKGLYPYSKHYLQSIKNARGEYWANHFSTIGLVGVNEGLLNFMNKDIGSKEGKRFAEEIMDHMRERIILYQEETGNMYNLEATPAEGTAYRLAEKDRERYKDIITAGTKDVPYYTNSTQLPVNYTDDAFEALDLQDEIQSKYTGGTAIHLFLGEKVTDTSSAKKFIKTVFENYELPYISITPTFSICPTHGYLSGEHFMCHKCTIEQPCEVYSRIVGYLRPVSQWNKGKSQEFKERKEYKEPQWSSAV